MITPMKRIYGKKQLFNSKRELLIGRKEKMQRLSKNIKSVGGYIRHIWGRIILNIQLFSSIYPRSTKPCKDMIKLSKNLKSVEK